MRCTIQHNSPPTPHFCLNENNRPLALPICAKSWRTFASGLRIGRVYETTVPTYHSTWTTASRDRTIQAGLPHFAVENDGERVRDHGRKKDQYSYMYTLTDEGRQTLALLCKRFRLASIRIGQNWLLRVAFH